MMVISKIQKLFVVIGLLFATGFGELLPAPRAQGQRNVARAPKRAGKKKRAPRRLKKKAKKKPVKAKNKKAKKVSKKKKLPKRLKKKQSRKKPSKKKKAARNQSMMRRRGGIRKQQQNLRERKIAEARLQGDAEVPRRTQEETLEQDLLTEKATLQNAFDNFKLNITFDGKDYDLSVPGSIAQNAFFKYLRSASLRKLYRVSFGDGVESVQMQWMHNLFRWREVQHDAQSEVFAKQVFAILLKRMGSPYHIQDHLEKLTMEMMHLKALQGVLGALINCISIVDRGQFDGCSRRKIACAWERIKEIRNDIGDVSGQSAEVRAALAKIDMHVLHLAEVTSEDIIEDVCTICQENLKETSQDTGPVVRLACHKNHQYHRECITQWLEREAKCPICRADAMSPIPTTDDAEAIIDGLGVRRLCDYRSEIMRVVWFLSCNEMRQIIERQDSFLHQYGTIDNWYEATRRALFG